MMREEKVGERECEGGGGGGEEGMAKKWREGLLVGNRYERAGPSTPPPIWRLLHFSQPPRPPPRDGDSSAVDGKEFLKIPAEAEVSARKLCADLWEMEQLRPKIMRRGLRKLRRRDKVEEEACVVEPPHDHQPLSTGSLRRQISARLGPNHRLVQRNGHAVQPVSPASYSSSLEVAACKRLLTPSDSLEFKSPSFCLKTSTKLLKVLNRIWSLEEQHAANMSLVKALKMELGQCRVEIKELRQEKHTDRECNHEVKEKNKSVRRRMEQEKLKDSIQSCREELEKERKLRRQSRDLHRKLAHELYEVKRCFAETLKELERERRARILMEKLCDEFAGEVKEHEDDVRRLASKSPVAERGNIDRLIVHVAEAWLDERAQMKLEEDEDDSSEKNIIVDKLGLDIETFLRARRPRGPRTEETSRPRPRSTRPNRSCGVEKSCSEGKGRCHLDLNRSTSRRQGKGSESREKSADSDAVRQRVCSSKLEKAYNTQNPQHECSDYHTATSKARFEENETRRDDKLQFLRDLCGRKSECECECVVRNESVSSHGIKIHPESSPNEAQAEHCGSHVVDNSAACPKQPRNVKEDSLQAKLMEARLESRRPTQPLL